MIQLSHSQIFTQENERVKVCVHTKTYTQVFTAASSFFFFW